MGGKLPHDKYKAAEVEIERQEKVPVMKVQQWRILQKTAVYGQQNPTSKTDEKIEENALVQGYEETKGWLKLADRPGYVRMEFDDEPVVEEMIEEAVEETRP